MRLGAKFPLALLIRSSPFEVFFLGIITGFGLWLVLTINLWSTGILFSPTLPPTPRITARSAAVPPPEFSNLPPYTKTVHEEDDHHGKRKDDGVINSIDEKTIDDERAATSSASSSTSAASPVSSSSSSSSAAAATSSSSKIENAHIPDNGENDQKEMFFDLLPPPGSEHESDDSNGVVVHAGLPVISEERSALHIDRLGLKPIDLSRVPVIIIAKDRHLLLKECISSLLTAKGSIGEMISVYQHGYHSDTREVAQEFRKEGVTLHQNGQHMKGGEAHVRIAKHYKFALSHAFKTHQDAKYVIIVEEDMVVSPDFFEYFRVVGGLYEVDDSVYCISTWNDNGFKGRVKDPKRLLRSEFFMGLGWMASRKIFQDEWVRNWPDSHWDHWIRDPKNRKGRECIYPEVSRNRNVGRKGEHVDDKFYKRFLSTIQYTEDVDSALSLFDAVKGEQTAYDEELGKIFQVANISTPVRDLERHKKGVFAFYFDDAPRRGNHVWETHEKDPWAKLAREFGLWHEFRAFRQGLVRFWHEDNYLLLVQKDSPAHQALQQIHGGDEVMRITPGESLAPAGPPKRIVIGAQQESCTEACRRHQMRCSEGHLVTLNDCDEMRKYVQCEVCETNGGGDLPAKVVAKDHSNYGKCLTNTHPFSCDGSHKVTRRFCPCV